MKIIFLDIDGVLCLQDNFNDKHRDQYGFFFNEKCVDNLGRIIKETGAYVIITSAWGISGLKVMKQMWSDRKMPGNSPVVDIIQGYLPTPGYPWRVDQIMTCLREKSMIKQWVAIDDDLLLHKMPEDFAPHLVQVCGSVGLTEADAKKAIEILQP